jgi:hypothetical protein
MTWRDAVMFLLLWLAIGLIFGPFMGKKIKEMGGDEE